MIEGMEESVDARLEEQFDVLRRALRAEVFDENVESGEQEAEGALSALSHADDEAEADDTVVRDSEGVDANAGMEEPQEGEE